MSAENLDQAWKVSKRPANISRSFQFETYDELRQFLDDLADVSEKAGYYPNLNFTRTQVNVSIESDADELGNREYQFAEQTDALLTQQAA